MFFGGGAYLYPLSGKNTVVNGTIMTSIYARPKPNASLAWSSNQQRETARHEYFSLLSLLETAVGSSRAAARGGLFGSLHPFNKV